MVDDFAGNPLIRALGEAAHRVVDAATEGARTAATFYGRHSRTLDLGVVRHVVDTDRDSAGALDALTVDLHSGPIGDEPRNGDQGLHLPGETTLDRPLLTIEMRRRYVGEERPGRLLPRLLPGIRYYDEEQRKQFLVEIREGRLYDAKGELLNTRRPGRNRLDRRRRAIWVMDHEGNLLVTLPRTDIHHSSLTAGGPVAGAGSLKVTMGRLDLLTDVSGHYRPDRKYTQQVVDRLRAHGLSVDPHQIQLTSRK
ncbi:hypothetical protein AB0C34_20975 [Nocardia sp. NPDC049220]|uniref:hypothetical protein n=1 Tax=Nocardia sp. NPDC049220 TaxID=3155273 RepID=UPI0033FB4390